MSQESAWEREYRKSKLLTKENKPQADVVRFAKWLKEENFSIEGKNVLDLGSGAGRNSFYFAELGAKVIGYEISKMAIEISKRNLEGLSYDISYDKRSIGEKFSVNDEVLDIVLDVTSSNSLTQSEREVYLSETKRVLRSDGYFFVKALCKDGDPNAKYLIRNHPGKEKDTYIMPGLEVTERVWTKEDFISTYEKYFKIVKLDKKTSYSRMNDRVYKRNFWICYMKKQI